MSAEDTGINAKSKCVCSKWDASLTFAFDGSCTLLHACQRTHIFEPTISSVKVDTLPILRSHASMCISSPHNHVFWLSSIHPDMSVLRCEIYGHGRELTQTPKASLCKVSPSAPFFPMMMIHLIQWDAQILYSFSFLYFALEKLSYLASWLYSFRMKANKKSPICPPIRTGP